MSAEKIPAEVKVAAIAALSEARRMGQMRQGNPWEPIARLVLADRTARPASDSGCMCRAVEIGSHAVSVLMELPEHMSALREARVRDGLSPYITVDACLVEEVRDLWSRGIHTTGCCCGHNKARGFIGVAFDDIPAMKEMGYTVRTNEVRPSDEDSFYPKSIRPPASDSALADVAAERARQITEEGWSLAHDDRHTLGELSLAAALYAIPYETMIGGVPMCNQDSFIGLHMALEIICGWDLKPEPDHRKRLVKAAAMLVAEIERLDRAALKNDGAV